MNITKATRIYITGCGGMLGDAVYHQLAPMALVKATDVNTTEPWLDRADVRDHAFMRRSIEEFRPDVIINLAAVTDLEQCEREPDEAWRVNALAAEQLGLIAAGIDAVYVYVSTGCVFDGTKRINTDTDTTNPINVYGKSKYFAEVATRRRVPKHCVVRAGWMMGGGPSKDKKFVNNIYKQICSGVRELSVVDSTLGTPTYTVDFANGLRCLIESGIYGLYHQAGNDHCTRFEMAEEFVRLLGLSADIDVRRVDETFFAQRYLAPRPCSEALENTRLTENGMNVMRDWRTCLGDYARVFAQDLEQRRHSVQALR